MARLDFLLKAGAKIPTLLAVAALSLSGATGCDLVRGGGRTYDAVPSGAVLLYQAPFSGSVTGTAQVYQSGGQVLLHLEGVTASARYYVFLETGAPSSPVYVSQMKAATGSQNYSTGLGSSGQAFSRVALRETATWTSTEVASAALQAVVHVTSYGVGEGIAIEL
jgi:hypothetical protein